MSNYQQMSIIDFTKEKKKKVISKKPKGILTIIYSNNHFEMVKI